MWMSKHYVHMGFDIWSHFALENSLTYDIFDSLRFWDGALSEVFIRKENIRRRSSEGYVRREQTFVSFLKDFIFCVTIGESKPLATSATSITCSSKSYISYTLFSLDSPPEIPPQWCFFAGPKIDAAWGRIDFGPSKSKKSREWDLCQFCGIWWLVHRSCIILWTRWL
mgnify:CR=1 FL=1